MVGLVTAVLFLGVGGVSLSEGRWLFGGVIFGLGVLRVVVLGRQFYALSHQPDEA